MSYNAIEVTTDSGQPVELYIFQQNAKSWHYNTSPDTVVHVGVDYVPATIVRSSVNQNSEISKSGITLTFPRNHEFASQFLGMAPDTLTTLTVLRAHITDSAQEFQVYWKGRVITGNATEAELNLECESVFSSMRRTGLRARYQLGCRHALYSTACGVNKASYKVSGLVQSATASSLVCTQAGAFADGYFSGGMIELPSGASRFITSHVGAQLWLSRPFIENIGGLTIDIYPGCDHSQTTCEAKFGAGLNFGGFPYIPIINPFGGTSIV